MDTTLLAPPRPVVTAARWADPDGRALLATIDGAERAVPNDPSNLDRQAVAAWEAAGHAIAPHVAPPAPVPDVISDRQFAEQAAIAGLITEAEALAWVGPGTIPPTLTGLVDGLPAEMQFSARMHLTGATTFERTHPLTATLAFLFGWTDAQRDDFWTAAALL